MSFAGRSRALWRVVGELGRVSNLPSVWFNLAGGWFLAGGTWSWSLIPLILGGAGFYLAGMTWNDAADAKWDRMHKQERPIPSGRISTVGAWVLGGVWMTLGWVGALTGGASWVWCGLLTLVIFFYDIYHKPWPGSVVVMGLCRALLYPLAASAAGFNGASGWAVHPWWWGGVLGYYIIGLTLFARTEAKGGAGLGLAATMLVLPVAMSLAALVVAPVTGAWLCWLAFVVLLVFVTRFMHDKSRPDRIGRGVGWLLAGMIAVDLMALALAGFAYSWVLLPVIGVLRGFQRYISAT